MPTTVTVDRQNPAEDPDAPGEAELQHWLELALAELDEAVEVTVRIVDADESRALNETYRAKEGPTNVLSFPFETPAGVELSPRLLGDLVICAPVVRREAADQGKPERAHWAHMSVHGALHLIGYDHQEEQQATRMESAETRLMSRLGFANPYQTA